MTKTRVSRGPIVGAVGSALGLVSCCLLAPALLGTAWGVDLGMAVEVPLIALALVSAAFALRRHRAKRSC
jgi:hypothetical protein